MTPTADDLRADWQSASAKAIRIVWRPLNRDSRTAPAGTFCRARNRRGRLQQIEAGVLSPDARLIFVHGQCHALAFAMWEATSWPIVWSGVRHRHSSLVDPGHLLVLHPSDQLLDFNGMRSIEDELKSVRAYAKQRTEPAVGVLTADLARQCLSEFRRPAMSLARSFVDGLLNEFGGTPVRDFRSVSGGAVALG